MSDVIKALEISIELRKRLDLMKRVFGDQWSDHALPYRIVLTALMRKRNTGVMAQALLLAKKLDERGEDPTMLLAAAAEMAMEAEKK